MEMWARSKSQLLCVIWVSRNTKITLQHTTIFAGKCDHFGQYCLLFIKMEPVLPQQFLNRTWSVTRTPTDWVMGGGSAHRTQAELTLRHSCAPVREEGLVRWCSRKRGGTRPDKWESCLQRREGSSSHHGRLQDAALLSSPPAPPVLQTYQNK